MKENGWKLFVNILSFWKNCFIDIMSQKMFNFKLIFFKWIYCHFGNLQTTGLSFRCISCSNSNDYELNGQEFVAPKPTPSLLLQPNQSLKSAHSPWVARKFSKCGLLTQKLGLVSTIPTLSENQMFKCDVTDESMYRTPSVHGHAWV